MKRLKWLPFLVLMGLNGIFSAPGGSVEKTAASAPEKEGRVAVVIGNSNYPSGALTNPKNDATVMAAALKKLGFDVELKLDGTKAELDGVFKRFSAKAEKARVAALFYAGHGIQVGGSNYLVPIDANPKHERDLKREMVKMDDIIDDMGEARVKLVFFDACRDNPLSRSFSRGGSRGMAAPVEATGTLISFATKHGNTASDGEGKHSPYTTALLEALESSSGVEIEQLLRRVQQGVKQATNGQQEPWRYGSLDGDFYFKAAETSANSARLQQAAVDSAVAAAMKSQQETSRRTVAEALKAQQEANDRAIAEAIRRSNEQAARERAELQASMEKVLKDALARQNEALEAARLARGEPTKPSGSTEPLPAPAAKRPPSLPIILASVPSTDVAGRSGVAEKEVMALANAPGDEWEYLATDEMFGKKQKLVLRVKAVSTEGVLEEIIWKGKPVLKWVFGSRAAAIGTPNESEFMFAPHWDGSEFSDLQVDAGQGMCARFACRISVKVSRNEKLTIAAGTFDAIRLDGWLNVAARFQVSGPVTIWYSKDHRRLLKQSAALTGNSLIGGFKETLELSAIRPAAANVSKVSLASAQSQPPIRVASIGAASVAGSAAPSGTLLTDTSSTPGDEWEYLAKDEMFGKMQKLVLLVKAISAEGVLEELVWNGKPVLEWVFGARAAAIGAPNESEFMFAPHWDGSELSDLPIEGGRSVCTNPGMSCQVSLKVSGTEKLTIAAGTFDAIRLEGYIYIKNAVGASSGSVTVWYSKDQRRLLKQVAKKNNGRIQFNETLELSAIRRAPR